VVATTRVRIMPLTTGTGFEAPQAAVTPSPTTRVPKRRRILGSPITLLDSAHASRLLPAAGACSQGFWASGHIGTCAGGSHPGELLASKREPQVPNTAETKGFSFNRRSTKERSDSRVIRESGHLLQGWDAPRVSLFSIPIERNTKSRWRTRRSTVTASTGSGLGPGRGLNEIEGRTVLHRSGQISSVRLRSTAN
jgi:hypothetical protein